MVVSTASSSTASDTSSTAGTSTVAAMSLISTTMLCIMIASALWGIMVMTTHSTLGNFATILLCVRS